MKTAYVVLGGDWDYIHVKAVFTTIEKAERYVAGRNQGDEIEEHPLDPEENP